MSRLFSTTQLAEYLNLSPVTIRRKAKKGDIPSIRIGNRLRFDKQQIDRWLLQISDIKKMRILVVDDEPLIGRLFRDNLLEHGHQVTTVPSGLEALELLSSRSFDLIFLDLVMPGMDGAEFLRRIRQADNRVPVAVITAYADSDIMNRAMDYEPFTVLKKPFRGSDILDTVRSLQ